MLNQDLPFTSLKVYKENKSIFHLCKYLYSDNYWIKTSNTNFFQSVFTDIKYITVLYTLDVMMLV